MRWLLLGIHDASPNVRIFTGQWRRCGKDSGEICANGAACSFTDFSHRERSPAEAKAKAGG
jgi:hypothetical protein